MKKLLLLLAFLLTLALGVYTIQRQKDLLLLQESVSVQEKACRELEEEVRKQEAAIREAEVQLQQKKEAQGDALKDYELWQRQDEKVKAYLY
ncbi:MAG: hypothetical protein IKE21_03995 [Erysipelotrichaceae bacterium]|nr:hypothetical protein [Erysipelotrichaceae bacterium]